MKIFLTLALIIFVASLFFKAVRQEATQERGCARECHPYKVAFCHIYSDSLEVGCYTDDINTIRRKTWKRE